jgi:polyhydroxyalkanoate synthesis regulator phasin
MTVIQRAKTMSEDTQLSEEQLQEVAGGLNQRFKESREEVLNKTAEEGELSEDQLKDVAGGLNERFQEERESTLNKLNERFEKSQKDNLDS